MGETNRHDIVTFESLADLAGVVSEIQERLTASLADRYKVERELGHGGMATVYLATDIRHDRQVAIKVLKPELSATIGSERFEREIKLAAKLQHPHILGLHDSGSAAGLLFFVMPFVEGESVRDRLDRERQLPVDDALQITVEVADALGYAHAHSVVHRDIKPENVMISGGHALVADFGIARAAGESSDSQKLTATGISIGTPTYMAPEQAAGDTVGPTADIYSLGCMLFEMPAGEAPFTGSNPVAIMAKHAMEGVPSVRIVRPSAPEEVEEAIFAAMEKSPADRPKTAAAFCEIMGTPLGATAARRTMRHTASRRVLTSGSLPRRPTLALPAARPLWKRGAALGAGVAVLAAIGFAALKFATGGSAALPPDPLDRKVAVRYFHVDGGDVAQLKPAAERLTESLIRDLSTASALTVTSANGVAPFRDENIHRDSVASALKVGTVVEGTVAPDGPDRVLITTRLYDRSGAPLERRPTTISVSRDSLFAAEEAVAREVSSALREAFGPEIEIRELQAGTRSSIAWTQFNRAERARREAAAFGPAKRDSAVARLNTADALLREAREADGSWIEPPLQAIQVAYERRRFAAPAKPGTSADTTAAILAVLDTALQRVDVAIGIDAASGKAFEWRGTIKYEMWRVGRRAMDPVVRNALLTGARDDLLGAIDKDESLVTAYATLSNVYYDLKDVPAALNQARIAYQRDEFLTNSQALLSRLFYGSYDTQLFEDARDWCDKGAARFPANYTFTMCRMWQMLEPDVTPDIPGAWQLSVRLDSLAPPFMAHVGRMIVGGVIGRHAKTLAAGPQQTALLDSARRVLENAQGDRSVDPSQELPGYRAIMLAQFGENDEAISLLTAYIAANPDHSFRVGGNVHWWWRDIRNHPGFRALLDRTR